MNSIESGAVFLIPLPKKKGVGYGKYVHLPDVTGHVYDSHLFRIYDFFTEKPTNDINEVLKSNLLISPLMMARKPKIRGLGWKVIGNSFLEEDAFFPDFKEYRGSKWVLARYYENGELSEEYDVNEQRVSHLEYAILRSEIEIPERIFMELLRKEAKDVEKELDFDGEDKEMLSTYEKMKGIPIYSKIPEEFKGRALPEGVELKLLD